MALKKSDEILSNRIYYCDLLREIRLRCGFSQSAVSYLTGISVNSLERIEKGCFSPSLDLILVLLNIYHKDLRFSDYEN